MFDFLSILREGIIGCIEYLSSEDLELLYVSVAGTLSYTAPWCYFTTLLSKYSLHSC